MKSNELNEILNKTRRTPNISLTSKQVEELVKDLERLEAIDNANPSEVLESLETLFDILCEREHTNSEHNFWLKQYNTIKQTLLKAQEQDKILKILKDKEVDVNFFKTLIPFHKEEDLMRKYNETRWKGELTLEETIKIKEWLDGR